VSDVLNNSNDVITDSDMSAVKQVSNYMSNSLNVRMLLAVLIPSKLAVYHEEADVRL